MEPGRKRRSPLKRTQIANQFAYLKALTAEIPGAPPLPVAISRLAVWRVRCTAKRGTFVPAWGSATEIYCPSEWRGNAKLSYVMRGAIEPDLAIAVALVEPGSLVLDVGAHYGSFSLPLARAVGPTGTVIALEPNPAARSVLARGLAANSLANVSVLPYAASDKAGSSLLGLEADPSRSSLVAQRTSSRTVEVELRTLDEVLKHRTQALHLLKVDVEGHEAEVFRGAIATLMDDKPIILFEDLLGPGSSTRKWRPVDFLRERGYSLRELWNGAWHDVDAYHHHGKNLWAFPRSREMPSEKMANEPSYEVDQP